MQETVRSDFFFTQKTVIFSTRGFKNYMTYKFYGEHFALLGGFLEVVVMYDYLMSGF